MVREYVRLSNETILGYNPLIDDSPSNVLIETSKVLGFLLRAYGERINLISENQKKNYDPEKINLTPGDIILNNGVSFLKINEINKQKGLENFLSIQQIPTPDLEIPQIYMFNAKPENSLLIERAIKKQNSGVKWGDYKTFEEHLRFPISYF
jgi:hypothetical protein